MYYDYAVSSVYVVESSDGGQGFNAAFLVKKELRDVKEITYGCWDAIHIVTCSVTSSTSAHYKVISTVMISMDAATPELGKMGIHGSCAKSQQADVQFSEDFKKNPDSFHLRNIGKLIELNEERLRSEVADTYSAKQR